MNRGPCVGPERHRYVGISLQRTRGRRSSAEATVRALVRANAEKDMETMSRLIAHDADITSYTIGGENTSAGATLNGHGGGVQISGNHRNPNPGTQSVDERRSSLVCHGSRLHPHGHDRQPAAARPASLRETGVLERRDGHWVLLSWHESLRTAGGAVASNEHASVTLASSNNHLAQTDLSGEWEILEVEDDKRYRATLDKAGNGPYTQHGGRFTTSRFSDRLWQGTWQQPGNDREGGFEILLSEDGKEAKGVWWYTRVGTHKNIPPREHGGTYQWKRITRSPPPLDEPAIGS